MCNVFVSLYGGRASVCSGWLVGSFARVICAAKALLGVGPSDSELAS